MNDDKIMNLKEAAAFLGISSATLATYVKDGRIPCNFIPPRTYRFSRNMLIAWDRQDAKQEEATTFAAKV